jgi:hypothetical protein
LRLHGERQACKGKGYSAWTLIPSTRAIVKFTSEVGRCRTGHATMCGTEWVRKLSERYSFKVTERYQ